MISFSKYDRQKVLNIGGVWGVFVTVVIAATVTLLGGLVLLSMRDDPARARTLLIEDLPKVAHPITHMHTRTSPEADVREEERAEMEHYATDEAMRHGGPIYGVYGYRVVSIEYEIPLSAIGERPVGEADPGSALSTALLTLSKKISYDHFHVGSSESDFGGEKRQPVYRIHFLLLPHEEEMSLGLSCG